MEPIREIASGVRVRVRNLDLTRHHIVPQACATDSRNARQIEVIRGKPFVVVPRYKHKSLYCSKEAVKKENINKLRGF